MAVVTAAVRSLLTVASPTSRARPISGLDNPRDTASSTSRSREVTVAAIGGVLLGLMRVVIGMIRRGRGTT